MSVRKSALCFFSSGLVLLALLLAATPALAYFMPGNYQDASLVLGQPDFVSSSPAATQTGMHTPSGVALDPASHKVFVADTSNNRVLRFASLFALANGAPAEAVLGQPDFTGSTAHTTRNGMSSPNGVFVDAAGRLWVADFGNNRVLRFDGAASLANGANASAVLGQPNYTSGLAHTTQNGMAEPSGVFVDAAGRLWVADYENSRVLRFDGAAGLANGANAAVVLGQPNFTTSAAGTTQSKMNWPYGMLMDSAGRLWVADRWNNRVLRFDGAAGLANGANASAVLGQPNFSAGALHTTQAGMHWPTDVALDPAGRLYVADSLNDRILVFNGAAGLANGAKAAFVLGQVNFISNAPNNGGFTSAAPTLFQPLGLFYDPMAKVLFAADSVNQRVVMYGKPSRHLSFSSMPEHDGWVLESSETSSTGGSMSTSGALRLGDDAANRQYRSIVCFDTSMLPDTAVLRSVTLKIKKAGVVGTEPLGSFGKLLADISLGGFGSVVLENADFQAAASANAIGHFTPVPMQPGWYQLVVPAADYSFVDVAGMTQFRLRFEMDDNNNHVADYDTFYAGDAASAANRPVLSVEYSLP